MFDTPLDKTIQDSLKAQAKFTAFAIFYSLVEANHKPISDDRIKGLADVIYTCLYAFQYGSQSPSTEEFLKFHADEMKYAKWEPELLKGVEE
jgi:hypothetical protein